MRTYNWLFNYRFDWGLNRSFEGLKYRASGISETAAARSIVFNHRVKLQDAYRSFFPELSAFTLQTLTGLRTIV